MNGSSGIGDSSFKEISGPSGADGTSLAGGPSGADIEKALHTPVKSINQLKTMLEDTLGKKDGEKLFNSFIKSFAMMMLQQIEQSASQAHKAAENMNKDTDS